MTLVNRTKLYSKDWKKKLTNPIDDALGLRPLEDIEVDESEEENLPATIEDDTEIALKQEDPMSDDETLKDIELARKNIQNIIEHGDDSLKEMISLAKQSESPRAFEVASGLMKTLLDANRDFVEMSMKKKYQKEELTGGKEKQPANQVTNNNLILSTSELLNMLRGEKNDE